MIKIEGFRVRTDKFQWVIEKKYIKEDGGDIYYIPVSYHPNLKWVSKTLLEYDLRDTEFNDLKEIIEKLKEFEDGIKIIVENDHDRAMV